MNKELELRMYFLVLYSLSGIQKGIQCGHAAIEYERKFKNTTLYNYWANHHKTFIILDGGTTNDGVVSCYGEEPAIGTLQECEKLLNENNINFATFKEPDLNSSLTSISLIADERVFNHKDYPNFMWFCEDKMDQITWIKEFKNRPYDSSYLSKQYPELYNKWFTLIGNERNIFLKDFLQNFKLAH